ncbi:MAG: glycosyltransferase, partial [Bacillota bacterium]
MQPPIRPGASVVQRLASIARTTARFIWRLLWTRPDVVYVRQHPASLVCTLTARSARVPVVLEVNGPPRSLSLSWPMLQRFDNLAARAAEIELRFASGVIAVTPELAAWSKRARGPTKGNVWVIPNGANIQLMRPVPDPAVTEFGLQPDCYVLFAGALAVWQG